MGFTASLRFCLRDFTLERTKSRFKESAKIGNFSERNKTIWTNLERKQLCYNKAPYL